MLINVRLKKSNICFLKRISQHFQPYLAPIILDIASQSVEILLTFTCSRIVSGVHDLRFCCTDHRAIVRRYDVPPFPRPRLGGSNRITHAVYNSSGTEILLNTRTIGLFTFLSRSASIEVCLARAANNDWTLETNVWICHITPISR